MLPLSPILLSIYFSVDKGDSRSSLLRSSGFLHPTRPKANFSRVLKKNMRYLFLGLKNRFSEQDSSCDFCSPDWVGRRELNCLMCVVSLNVRILLMPTVEKVLKQKELFQISFVLHHRYFNLALFFELHLGSKY